MVAHLLVVTGGGGGGGEGLGHFGGGVDFWCYGDVVVRVVGDIVDGGCSWTWLNGSVVYMILDDSASGWSFVR